jgi:Bacterial PH domain
VTGDAQTLTCRAVRVRKAPWVRSLTSGWLTTLLFLGSCTAVLPTLGLGAPIAALGLAVVAHFALVAWSSRTRAGGSVTLRPGGALTILHGEDALALDKAAVRAGYEQPTSNGAVLELADGRELTLSLERGEADLVLEHVGVGVAQRSVTLPLRATIGAGTYGFIGFVVGSLAALFLGLPPWLAPAVGLASGSLLGRVFGRPRVTIGADGVVIRDAFRTRFIPFSRIVGAAKLELGGARVDYVELLMRDGTRLPLPLLGQPREVADAIQARIQQAAAHQRLGQKRSLDALRRAGRPIAEWRTELGRVALADVGFRQAAISSEDLERVLCDTSAPTDERLGAALALRAADPNAGARIRVAAEATADETLRNALLTTASDDIDEGVLDEATARASER